MNAKFMAPGAAASMLILAHLTSAQALPAQAPVPVPVQPASAPPGAALTAAGTNALASEPAAQGTVAQLLINPNGDVDGLLLADGTQVQFPPHLSPNVIQITRPGDAVIVQGFRGYGVPVVHATVITNRKTGQSVIDEPPQPGVAPPPAALTALTARGAVTRMLYTDRGELNGVLLADRTVVRFPPPLGAQLQAMLHPGAVLSASGYGTQNGYGRALEATSLSLDGQPPVGIYGPPR
jgi:hypothetical protein